MSYCNLIACVVQRPSTYCTLKRDLKTFLLRHLAYGSLDFFVDIHGYIHGYTHLVGRHIKTTMTQAFLSEIVIKMHISK